MIINVLSFIINTVIIPLFGMKLFLKKYVISSEIVRENGKKITVLTLNSEALLKDGVLQYHLAGGLCATVGNTILVLDTVKSSTTENDLGFMMNHEVGHLVLGHVAKAVKRGASGLMLDLEDEVAADNYARSKGFKSPDFRKLLTGVYGELATAGIILADKVAEYVDETLEVHASRM